MGSQQAITSDPESVSSQPLQENVAAKVTGTAFQAGPEIANSQPGVTQNGAHKLSPEAALDELIAGNRRFTSGRTTGREFELAMVQQKTLEMQQPFAAVLSCADSRVPVEVIFNQTVGHIFVTRVAGNIVTAEIVASLEYAAAVLGTNAILVMGHGNCGAVTATIQGQAVPGQISALFRHIQPAVEQAGPDLDATIRANAQIQAARLLEASPLLAEMAKDGKLKVAAGFYDIRSSAVTLLDAAGKLPGQ